MRVLSELVGTVGPCHMKTAVGLCSSSRKGCRLENGQSVAIFEHDNETPKTEVAIAFST